MIRIDKQMHRKKIASVQIKLIPIQYLFSWFLVQKHVRRLHKNYVDICNVLCKYIKKTH